MIEHLAQAVDQLLVDAVAEDILEALRLRDALDAKIDQAAAQLADDADIWFTAA